MNRKLAIPARKLAAPLSACILVLSGSGCAGLSTVGSLMAGPLPKGDSVRTPPLGHCMRNWSLPECQPGAGSAPADGNQRQIAHADERVRTPAAPARGNAFSPPLGYCVRNWALPECQNGVTPVTAGGEPREAPDPADPAAKPAQGLGAFIAVLGITAMLLVLSGVIASAVAASIYP